MVQNLYKSNSSETESFVSDYLLNNPDYFRRHPQVFTHMSLPRQNRDGTRSVVECQNEVLRATLTTYEMREEELRIREKQILNQYSLQNMLTFATKLLSCDNLPGLPVLVLNFYKTYFGVSHGMIRLWDLSDTFSSCPFAKTIGAELESAIDAMGSPYWGINSGTQVAQWLSVDPKETVWVFILPLRGAANKAFGMVCLASGTKHDKKDEDINSFLTASYPVTQAALYKLTNRNC